MFSGRKLSRFSIVDPIKKRKRQFLHIYRISQVVVSAVILALWYCFVPPYRRADVVTETCYPAVLCCLFFRVLTRPSAKISFYYNLYVNTIGVGLYSVVGTTDLYNGLAKRPEPSNPLAHYARLYLMLLANFMLVGDVLYIEFYEKNLRILPEKRSVGDAARARIEIALRKYEEALAKKAEKEAQMEADQPIPGTSS